MRLPRRSVRGMRCRQGEWWVVLVGMGLLLTLVGCKGEEYKFEPPSREEQVAEADSLLATVDFDTLAWASDSVRALRGNEIYSARCRRCHGTVGQAGTAYARERGLDVPSLVEEDWPYAGDLDGVRERIFAGHVAGMPTWGVAGITPREIDAVAFYILDVLRPEVLGTGGTPAATGEGRGSGG